MLNQPFRLLCHSHQSWFIITPKTKPPFFWRVAMAIYLSLGSSKGSVVCPVFLFLPFTASVPFLASPSPAGSSGIHFHFCLGVFRHVGPHSILEVGWFLGIPKGLYIFIYDIYVYIYMYVYKTCIMLYI